MIKFFSAILILAFCGTVQASVFPVDQDGSTFESVSRVFKKHQKTNYLFEFKNSFYLENQDNFSFRLGGKRRLNRHFKLGFYYQRSYGLKHNEDWDNRGDGWKWHNTTSRSENIFILELSPRFLVGKQSVFETRLQYEYNQFNENQSLKIRPGLTYFLKKNGGPYCNLFAQVEYYLALNFNENLIYQKWYYLGSLFHFGKSISIGPYFAYHLSNWTHYDDSKARIGEYEVDHTAKLFGLTFVMKI